MTDIRVLIPVKAFHLAKRRLSPALDAPARAELARRMAAGVVAAARHLPVSVVCDDAEVAGWAEALGADVLWQPRSGLDDAIRSGVDALAAAGAERVIVSHADLPLADDLTWVGDFDGVTLVPDRRDDGTNVASVPTGLGFTFAYGPGSFQRHAIEARRVGAELRVVCAPRLSWDVDLPEDLALPSEHSALAAPIAHLPDC